MSTSFPIIRFFEFDVTESVSPSGTRTTPGGSFAFKQQLARGCSVSDPASPGSTSGTLTFIGPLFQIINGNPPSEEVSRTAVVTFNLANSGVAISDMRLYLTVDTGLTIPAQSVGQDPAFIQILPSGSNWIPNLVLPSGAGTRLTTTVPTKPNVFRQDKANVLAGQDDLNSSEFIYMNLVVPWGFPLGDFGACASGEIRLGLLFNYYCNDYILAFGDVS